MGIIDGKHFRGYWRRNSLAGFLLFFFFGCAEMLHPTATMIKNYHENFCFINDPCQVRLNGVATFIGIVGLSVALCVLIVLLAR